MRPDEPPPDVAGLSLDGASPVVISAAENAALCASLGVAPDDGGEAHPSYYYSATQVGMGLTVAELCARCAFDVEDGPMLASSEAEFHAPLLTGTPYRVRGEIVSLTRKSSRKLGAMDLLQYRLRLLGPDGATAVETTNVWVLAAGTVVTVAVGERFTAPAVLVRPEAMKVWAAVLHDPNPIHLDPAVVRAKGLGDRVINQGPANTAYVIDALLANFPRARLRRLSVRFLGNLFGGEMAAASGVVTAVETGPEAVRVHLDVALQVDDRVVLSGAAALDL